MNDVTFYFQVHQPFRLRGYRFFDIGKLLRISNQRLIHILSSGQNQSPAMSAGVIYTIDGDRGTATDNDSIFIRQLNDGAQHRCQTIRSEFLGMPVADLKFRNLVAAI